MGMTASLSSLFSLCLQAPLFFYAVTCNKTCWVFSIWDRCESGYMRVYSDRLPVSATLTILAISNDVIRDVDGFPELWYKRVKILQKSATTLHKHISHLLQYFLGEQVMSKQ